MKYYGGPEGLPASAAELNRRQFPASGKLRSAGRSTNFSPTSNVELQPTANSFQKVLVRWILLCPFERDTATTLCVKCTQTEARESTEHKVGSYLPRIRPCPTNSAYTGCPQPRAWHTPYWGMRTLGKYFGEVLYIISDYCAYTMDTINIWRVEAASVLNSVSMCFPTLLTLQGQHKCEAQ